MLAQERSLKKMNLAYLETEIQNMTVDHKRMAGSHREDVTYWNNQYKSQEENLKNGYHIRIAKEHYPV